MSIETKGTRIRDENVSSYSCLISFSEEIHQSVFTQSRREIYPLVYRFDFSSICHDFNHMLEFWELEKNPKKLTFFFPAAFRAAILLSMSEICR